MGGSSGGASFTFPHGLAAGGGPPRRGTGPPGAGVGAAGRGAGGL